MTESKKQPGADRTIRVWITAKQARLIEQATAELQRVAAQRDMILTTLAASADFDGTCNFRGVEQKEGEYCLVLDPVAT